MKNQKEIEITINEDGTVTAEQIGWEGKACYGAIDELLTNLGKVVKSSKTKEYYKTQKVQINQKSKG